MTITPQIVSEKLTKAGIKSSATRIAVTEYILTHRTHPTADEIYRALSPEYPTLSRTTVYNTLRRLSETGMIRALDIESGNTHFDGITEFHAHFMCKKCGQIHDIDLNAPPPPEDIAKIDYTQVHFHGICKECFKANESITNN